MAIADTSPSGKRALDLAIIHAFFAAGSASHIATAFSTGGRKLHAADVMRIWKRAKQNGELPNMARPARGPKQKVRASA